MGHARVPVSDNGNAASRLWNRVRDQFQKEADHLMVRFFAEDGAVTFTPNDSYLRLWVSELFLADARKWGGDRIPAVQASARMRVTGARPQTLTYLVQPAGPASRGVFEDYQLTDWLPYRGQSVEVEAALHEILAKNNLFTAVEIVCDFAGLIAPPIAAALAIADMVAVGIEKVIEANAGHPRLVVHRTFALSGSSAPLQPGWLAVVRATERDFPQSSLSLDESGRLCLSSAPLTGYDYMVLRLEGCQDRPDWYAPDLQQAIDEALKARDLERPEYPRLRERALEAIYDSPDFTKFQRDRLLVTIRRELDEFVPGAAADGGMTIAEIVGRRGLPTHQQVAHLTFEELLAF